MFSSCSSRFDPSTSRTKTEMYSETARTYKTFLIIELYSNDQLIALFLNRCLKNVITHFIGEAFFVALHANSNKA